MKPSCRRFLLKAIAALAIALVSPAEAQVRITEVTISTRNVELTNFGTTSVNLATWQWCHRRSYAAVGGTIAPGASRQFTVGFNQTSSDLGLYKSSLFGSASDMEDFVQWGASFVNSGREGVAVTKGIWTSGFFFAVPPAGTSLHAKAEPPATGLRTTNWFPGWPHPGFPVPPIRIESIAITAGEWRIIAQSPFLTGAHRADAGPDLTTGLQQVPAPVIAELGNGRIDVRFPAAGERQFARLRAEF